MTTAESLTPQQIERLRADKKRLRDQVDELRERLGELQEAQGLVARNYLRRAWQAALDSEVKVALSERMVEEATSLFCKDFPHWARDDVRAAARYALGTVLAEDFDAGVYQAIRTYAGAGAWQPSWLKEAQAQAREEMSEST